jgi:hypothetical protein
MAGEATLMKVDLVKGMANQTWYRENDETTGMRKQTEASALSCVRLPVRIVAVALTDQCVGSVCLRACVRASSLGQMQ